MQKLSETRLPGHHPFIIMNAVCLRGADTAASRRSDEMALADYQQICDLFANIIFLIAGCLMDNTSAMYILVPIIMPIAQALDINMIHLGTIIVLNLSIGQVTPPVGPNLYVAADIGRVKFENICRKMVPLLIMSMIALFIITYVPWFSLSLIK